MNETPKILSLVSAKGGVGKSVLGANLAHLLSKEGYKTLLIDLNLGLGNQDILLGVNPKYNLLHYLKDQVNFEQISIEITPTLQLLPIDNGDEIFTFSHGEIISRILNEEKVKEFEYIILDLPCDISPQMSHFFKISDLFWLVSEPTPPAITNAYTFLKLAQQFQAPIALIFNKIRNEQEAKVLFEKMEALAHKHLTLSCDLFLAGSIPSDPLIERSTKNRYLFTQRSPNAYSTFQLYNILSHSLYKLEHKVLQKERRKSFAVLVRQLIEKL